MTAAQVRDVVMQIIDAGHWADGHPDILAVFDSGDDLTRLAWLLRDLPVEVAGRLRSDRVMHFPVLRPGPHARPGRAAWPSRHGSALKLCDPIRGPPQR